MDKTAIETIQGTAIAAANLDALIDADTKAVLLPDNYNLQSLEHLQLNRNRYRGQYKTTSLTAFARYCAEQNKADLQAFVDPESMTAKAFFNLGDAGNPGHGDHHGSLKLTTTAAWQAVKQIVGDNRTQKRLAEWLEDWRDNLKAVDATDDNIPLIKAIAAVRNITIASAREINSQQGDMANTRSAMEKVEASSTEGLPTGFLFTCKPYEDLAEQTIMLRMSITTGEETPRLTLRISQLEQLEEQISTEFAEKLRAGLETSNIYIGSFSL